MSMETEINIIATVLMLLSLGFVWYAAIHLYNADAGPILFIPAVSLTLILIWLITLIWRYNKPLEVLK